LPLLVLLKSNTWLLAVVAAVVQIMVVVAVLVVIERLQVLL
jgi:hypothetical protein